MYVNRKEVEEVFLDYEAEKLKYRLLVDFGLCRTELTRLMDPW